MDRYKVGLTIDGYLPAENQQDAETKVEDIVARMVQNYMDEFYYSIETDYIALTEVPQWVKDLL